jgi:hypothetical protein
LSAAFRQALASAGSSEASLALLDPARGLLAEVWTDLRALPTTRARLVLVRENLLPPPAFMYTRYGTRRRWLLPVLYARRLAGGGVRWLRDWMN